MITIEKSDNYVQIGNDLFIPDYRLIKNETTGNIRLESISNQLTFSFLFSDLIGEGGATYATLDDAITYLKTVVFVLLVCHPTPKMFKFKTSRHRKRLKELFQ